MLYFIARVKVLFWDKDWNGFICQYTPAFISHIQEIDFTKKVQKVQLIFSNNDLLLN